MKTAAMMVTAVLLLAGCDDGTSEPSYHERLMRQCTEAGGTFKYHGNSGSFDCLLPQRTDIKDHTS